MLGALIGGALSFLGGERANSASAEGASNQMGFQERMSNTSYQRAMADMKAAGLNPMLAYSQGGASVPVGAMPQVINSGAMAAQGFANVQSSSASATQAQTQANIGVETVSKIKQEVVNLHTDNERLKAVVTNLGEEYQNLVKQGYNLTEVGNHLRATIETLKAQVPQINSQTFLNVAQEALSEAQRGQVQNLTTLSGLDIQAAGSLSNLGREAGQVGPVIKMLVDILRATNRKGE